MKFADLLIREDCLPGLAVIACDGELGIVTGPCLYNLLEELVTILTLRERNASGLTEGREEDDSSAMS